MRGLILPDMHYAPAGDASGGIDEAAEAVGLRAARLIKPDFMVNLGDAGEWDKAGAWAWKRRKRPPLEFQLPMIQKEAEAVRAGLSKWDKALPSKTKRIFLCGNHDAWLDNFVEENPFLPEYKPEQLMRLADFGFEYHPYGEYVKVAGEDVDLWAYHGGHWSGQNHTRDHVRNLGKSVMYGHVHDAETSTGRTLGGPVTAWSMGCLCKLTKPFLKGRPTNWKHGFGVVTVHDNGTFQVEFVPIANGVSSVWGKRIAA
jgi:hypothetical protein